MSRKPKAQSRLTGNPYDLYIAWRWFLVGNTVLNIPPANIVINALGVHDEDPIAADFANRNRSR